MSSAALATLQACGFCSACFRYGIGCGIAARLFRRRSAWRLASRFLLRYKSPTTPFSLHFPIRSTRYPDALRCKLSAATTGCPMKPLSAGNGSKIRAFRPQRQLSRAASSRRRFKPQFFFPASIFSQKPNFATSIFKARRPRVLLAAVKP